MVRVLETFSDWLSVRTDIKINELRDYLDTLNKQLAFMAEDYEKKIEAQAKQIENNRERDEFYEWSSEEYWNYKETFPDILLNSFHVSVYILLESEIYSVSRRLGKKQKQLFVVSDFGGRDYLKLASFYINKLTGINAQGFASWQRIEDGRTLRNNIVHSNGILTKKHDIDVAKKYSLLKESKIEVTSGRSTKHLSITYDYNRSFIATLKEFFDELYKGMKAGDYL